MALSEYPSVAELKELAEKYGDVEITRADSLNAGNCDSGTDDFIETNLQGRTSVKVSDLLPYIDDYNGVQTVLAYKFRQLESEEKKEG